ncbi:helix-turn-helix domain-containing protein [Microtetraspora sp. NBRC 16547]|uniref:helix-turn-helix domain-containing protein n=1 Tax=Microtetraspora sp. NBRC 16547 TaxID=3030993 RepID=UPI0024A5B18F|nr:helix-turn-helix domain-containing protein [Microtetraspora sp. NBRC 16547]GLW99976.1 MerR family transcriptional regulator [Microtetraspora sp. NBRC 16547]
MSQQPYSVDQVAELLGLHVKTVRAYVRDGRLKATRIGKQYRITREDLEAFTGMPAPSPVRTSRHTEVSSIVQIDAISPEETIRLTNTVIAAAAAPPPAGERLRVETVYDEERASLKIIILGGLDSTAQLLKIITALTEERQ